MAEQIPKQNFCIFLKRNEIIKIEIPATVKNITKRINELKSFCGFLVNEGPKYKKTNPATIIKVAAMIDRVNLSLIHKLEPMTTINRCASRIARIYDKSAIVTAIIRNNQLRIMKTPPINQNLFLNKIATNCKKIRFPAGL